MVEALANLARTQPGRQRITDSDLVQRIGAGLWSTGDHSTAVQVCRLGGNLCFDSPAGRTLVLQADILNKLAGTVAALDTEDTSKLWLVLPSFLHNFCHDNLHCLHSVTDISTVLASHFSSVSLHQNLEAAAENYLGWLSGLQDHEDRLGLYSKPEVVTSLLHLLQVLQAGETLQTVLQFLQETLESEELSSAYADHDVVETLLKISTTTDEETASLSLDVLVLLSSHSSVLSRVLSPCSSCLLWTSLLSWLASPPSSHHLASAALLCGNICTSSAACMQVMETAAPAYIIGQLDDNNAGKVLHAVLGCLRNLAVCEAARERLLQLSLAEKTSDLLVSLSRGRDHTVTPKLMSTLRLVSQNSPQTCAQLGTNTELLRGQYTCRTALRVSVRSEFFNFTENHLAGLVTIGQVSVVPGLNIEATRLLSSVLRYSRQPSVGVLAVEAGALPLLLGLLNSPHSQLINEMLVALNLITGVRPPRPEVTENIDPEFLSTKIRDVLTMEEEKCPKQVKYNAISLVNSILQWDDQSIKDHFCKHELKEEIRKFDGDLDIVQKMMELMA